MPDLDEKTFAERMRIAMTAVLSGAHTSGPGLVKAVSGAHPDIRLRVQPMVAKFDADGETHVAPDIHDVVLLPIGGGGWAVEITPGVGDIVWLLHADRSLDEWKGKKSAVTPKAKRSHAHQDAVAIPLAFGGGVSLGIGLRSVDGLVGVSVTSTGVSIDGNLDVSGVARVGTAVPATTVTVNTHTHPVSGSATGAPNPG